MRDLRKALQDNSKSLVKSFVRWSDSTLSDKAIAGIAFADCTDLNNLDLVFENVHVSCMGQNLSLSLSSRRVGIWVHASMHSNSDVEIR